MTLTVSDTYWVFLGSFVQVMKVCRRVRSGNPKSKGFCLLFMTNRPKTLFFCLYSHWKWSSREMARYNFVFQWRSNCKGQIFIKFHKKSMSKSLVWRFVFPVLCEKIPLDEWHVWYQKRCVHTFSTVLSMSVNNRHGTDSSLTTGQKYSLSWTRTQHPGQILMSFRLLIFGAIYE